jgi:hypothetical protein
MDLIILISGFLYQNPLFILAFLMWIASGWASCHLLLRLARAGYANDFLETSKLIATLPSTYLRVRQSHGWAAWPGHLIWISSIGGFVAFAAGLLRFLL